MSQTIIPDAINQRRLNLELDLTNWLLTNLNAWLTDSYNGDLQVEVSRANGTVKTTREWNTIDVKAMVTITVQEILDQLLEVEPGAYNKAGKPKNVGVALQNMQSGCLEKLAATLDKNANRWIMPAPGEVPPEDGAYTRLPHSTGLMTISPCLIRSDEVAYQAVTAVSQELKPVMDTWWKVRDLL